MTATESTPWLDYWQTLPNGQLLFTPEAEEFSKNFLAHIPLPRTSLVLDYGCGYGSVARLLAPHVREIVFWDACPSMNAAAVENLSDISNAALWNGDRGFDLILVNSVVQYMRLDELQSRLTEWHDLLNPGGRVVLADLITATHRTVSDMRDLFFFSLRRGYLLQALRKTLAERSRYDATAKRTPLLRIDPAVLETDARTNGFTITWTAKNLSHFRGRRTAILTRPA